MPGKVRITEEEYIAVCEEAKNNQLKRIDKKLQIIILRYKGLSNQEIAEKLDIHPKYVSNLCNQFRREGLAVYISNKYKGNARAMTIEEEDEILKEFEKQASEGKVITVQQIKKAFDEKRGKDTGRAYIYLLLKRHNWRKVMPRSKHPKKADDVEIEASKKLKA